MFRLSKLTDYGTVVMTYLARQPNQVCSANEIAEGLHLTVPTVSKILKLLARENLVVSQRGVKGGYMLARPPGAISMAEVITAMEGAIGLTECGSTPGLCIHESCCTVRPNWQRINQGVRALLESVTLAEMTETTVMPPTGVNTGIAPGRDTVGANPQRRGGVTYGNRTP